MCDLLDALDLLYVARRSDANLHSEKGRGNSVTLLMSLAGFYWSASSSSGTTSSGLCGNGGRSH